MPKAYQICSHSGCLEISVKGGKCKAHGRKPWANTSARNLRRPKDWNSRRRFVRQRDRVCQLCGTPDNTEVDHRIPVSAGGGWDYDNLWLLCDPCHRKKTFRDAASRRAGYL